MCHIYLKILILYIKAEMKVHNIMKSSRLRLSLIIASLVAISGVVSICQKAGILYVNNELPPKKHTIVIDPGHGGYDPGKVGVNNTLEKNTNLAIALILRDILQDNNYDVIMTRSDDTDLCSPGCTNKKTDDLNNRIKIINEASPEIVVSIHQNSFQDPKVSGAQVFYYGDETKEAADILQSELVAGLNPENHRIAKSNTSYYLLKNTPFPVVIVECGFLSNPSEEELLNNDAYRQKTAEAIYNGIDKYLN